MKVYTFKNILKTYIIISPIMFFLIGFKSAISLRYSVQKRMLPERIADKYSVYFDPATHKSPYVEAFKRYIISTKNEYKKYQMDTLFNIETKSFLEWFIKKEKNKSKILDVGGATGIQWQVFKEEVKNKNISIALVEIDRNSIEIGKRKYASDYLKFYHASDLDKCNKEIDTILLCEVYIQIPNANKVLRTYLDTFPGAKAVVIHSTFKNNINTKIFGIFKQYVLKYLPVIDCLQGRAITDELFHKEITNAGMTIVEEHDITHLSKHPRPLRGRVKAYVLRRNIDISNDTGTEKTHKLI